MGQRHDALHVPAGIHKETRAVTLTESDLSELLAPVHPGEMTEKPPYQPHLDTPTADRG